MELIVAKNISIQRFGKTIFPNTSFTILKGDQLFIAGKNGAGKTSFLKGISKQLHISDGQINFPEFEKQKAKNPNLILSSYITMVDFNLYHYLPNYLETFYQQRFHACETDVFPTVIEFLLNERNIFIEKPANNPSLLHKIDYWLRLFNIEFLVNSSVITLSNGECKRLLLIKALLKSPEILIFDNPYIGLDTEGKKTINQVFEQLKNHGQTMIFAEAENNYPSLCNTFWNLENEQTLSIINQNKLTRISNNTDFANLTNDTNDAKIIVELRNIKLNYNNKSVFNELNWTIKEGEKWHLEGKNGTGKSSLMSFIYADHPQVYANNIFLFGKKRGQGETIWEIKQNIGYLSPELYLQFLKPYSCLEIVASGLSENKAIDRNYNEAEQEKAFTLLKNYNLLHKSSVSFLQISSGEQRIMLLLRALIKSPKLLILDEPFQGIDFENQNISLNLITEYFSKNPLSSLILITHQSDFKWSIINKKAEIIDGKLKTFPNQ